VNDVKWNGVSLTERATEADVGLNNNSWFADSTYVFVRLDGTAPFNHTIQAMAVFRLSTVPKVLDDEWYDPRLIDAPDVSKRIAATFTGIGQTGGGNLTLVNTDGYWNGMQDFQWHAGRVTLKLGVDLPLQAMAWADYETFGTWQVEDWTRDRSKFTLKLTEPNSKLKTKLPLTFFDRATYPNIDNNLIGKPIPLAYGIVYGVKPFLIDPGLRKFKVTSHAIRGFLQVRLKTTREEVSTATPDATSWNLYTGTTYRFYQAGGKIKNVTFDGVSLEEQNQVDDVTANPGSWTANESFVYVNPSGGETITSGVYEITIGNDISSFNTTSFASKDVALGEFTLGEQWNLGTEVSVDFLGKSSGGLLIEDGPSIIHDLFTAAGETNLDTASFSAATALLNIGTDRRGKPVYASKPALYLDEAEELGTILTRVIALTGAYSYANELGQVFCGVFMPQPGDGLPKLTDLDCLAHSEQTDSSETFSKVIATYAKREQDKFSGVEETESTGNQYLDGKSEPVIREEDTAGYVEREIEYWSRRLLTLDGRPIKKHFLTTPWQSIQRVPGEQLVIELDSYGVSGVFEVLEVNSDLGSKTIKLTLGDLRGLRDTPGFWVADSDLLPAKFATLAGYGSGSLDWNSAWHSEIKKWAQQNVGYWTDANGFADSNDPDSFMTSTWV